MRLLKVQTARGDSLAASLGSDLFSLAVERVVRLRARPQHQLQNCLPQVLSADGANCPSSVARHISSFSPPTFLTSIYPGTNLNSSHRPLTLWAYKGNC